MPAFRHDFPLTPAFQLVKPSIELLRKNPWPIVYLAFLPSLVIAVGSVLLRDIVVNNKFQPVAEHHIVGFGLVLAGLLYSLVTWPGLITAELATIRGRQPAAFGSFRLGLPRLWPLVVTLIASQLAISFGLVALIVPGIILFRSYYLYPYYVVDQKLPAIEALKRCRLDSKPNAGYIWSTIGVVVFFGICGVVLGTIPVIGYVLQLVVPLAYVFGPALRYEEIRKTQQR